MIGRYPMRRRNALQLVAAAPWLAFAPSTRATAPDLAGDIDLLGEVVQTLHPGLLRYNTAAQIDGGLVALKREFVAAPDLASRYLALSRFLATLQCGHSYANFFNQSRAVAAELFDGKTRLPFAFGWIGSEMVVTADHSGSRRLPRGSVVTAVNGVASADLLQTLLPYARADGNNVAKRRALLGVAGNDRIETFDVFHGLVYGAPPSGMHLLQLRLPSGKDVQIELPALTAAERRAFLRGTAAAASPNAPLWNWRTVANGVAVLTMPSWALYDKPWDWQAWLEDRLSRLPGGKGLIVDLRGNEGGLDCGDLIVERFARSESRLESRRLVRYRQTPAHLNRYLDTWDDSFRDWGDEAQRYDERYFRLADAPNTTLRPRAPRLDVPLVVLIGATNSSATFAFAQRIKALGAGTLVGETTGGNQRGINGGAFFFVRLPASGLEFDLPLIGSFALAPVPDAGIEPDLRVQPTVADIAAGRDPQLAAALALLGAA